MPDGSDSIGSPAREVRHREPKLLLLHVPIKNKGAARGGRPSGWASAAGAAGAPGSRLHAAVPRALGGCEEHAAAPPRDGRRPPARGPCVRRLGSRAAAPACSSPWLCGPAAHCQKRPPSPAASPPAADWTCLASWRQSRQLQPAACCCLLLLLLHLGRCLLEILSRRNVLGSGAALGARLRIPDAKICGVCAAGSRTPAYFAQAAFAPPAPRGHSACLARSSALREGGWQLLCWRKCGWRRLLLLLLRLLLRLWLFTVGEEGPSGRLHFRCAVTAGPGGATGQVTGCEGHRLRQVCARVRCRPQYVEALCTPPHSSSPDGRMGHQQKSSQHFTFHSIHRFISSTTEAHRRIYSLTQDTMPGTGQPELPRTDEMLHTQVPAFK